MENAELSVLEVWKQFSILDCIYLASHAISKIAPRILNSCWKVALPECVGDKHSTNHASDIITSIFYLSHKIGGEGFDNVEAIDIKKMFEDDIIQIILYL